MNKDCIFCKIAHRQVAAKIVLENDRVMAFDDISPKAPVHVVVIPKDHHENVMEVLEGSAIYPPIFDAVREVARVKGLVEKGFRVINNCGADGGQTVGHLHFHIMGGRGMKWPPG